MIHYMLVLFRGDAIFLGLRLDKAADINHHKLRLWSDTHMFCVFQQDDILILKLWLVSRDNISVTRYLTVTKENFW